MVLTALPIVLEVNLGRVDVPGVAEFAFVVAAEVRRVVETPIVSALPVR
jgi:hypothetical protein